MACGQRCADKYPWSLVVRPYEPPPSGWTLRELPPFITEERLRWAWRQRQISQNNSPEAAINEVSSFLRQNGLPFTASNKWDTSEFADNYWCSLAPSRCSPRPQTEAEPQSTVPIMELPKTTMTWAGRYWALTNTMFASDWDNPAEELDRIARVGLTLTRSDAGCKECHEHWKGLLEAFPPLSCVKDSADARCWLWRAHNFSRQGKPPTPLQDVVRGWQWPAISPQDAVARLARMGMDKL